MGFKEKGMADSARLENIINSVNHYDQYARLIIRLDKLKSKDCPTGNGFMHEYYEEDLPEHFKKDMERHLDSCRICYLISCVVLASKEGWQPGYLKEQMIKSLD